MTVIGDMHSYVPEDGHGLRFNPFNAIIAPRPIGWISSLTTDGVANLAPYSFFNAFLYEPPILGFSSIDWKDTVRNVEANGEFVWNLASIELAQAMNASSAPLPPGESEFAAAGLTAVASQRVSPPRVGESRAAMECKVTDIVRLRDRRGEATSGWLVLGEVVMVHIDRALVSDGVYDTAAARPILRAGRGGDYVEVTRDRFFEMPRPEGSYHPRFHGAA